MMEGFEMIWLNGNKYLVGSSLAKDIRIELQMVQNSWQEEHTQRIRLEEQLKAAIAKAEGEE